MTGAELIMVSALVAIAKDNKCDGCDWEQPCDKCFAAQMLSNVFEHPQFASWKKGFKLVVTRKKRKAKVPK